MTAPAQIDLSRNPFRRAQLNRNPFRQQAQPVQERLKLNPFREFAEGIGLALNRTGTGFIGLAGRIPGLGGLRDFAEENRRQAEEIFTPEGKAGLAGNIAGTILGEGATTLAGGGAALKGLQLAGRGTGAIARQAARAAGGLETLREGGLAARTAANVAPVVPVDLAIGASRAEEGQNPLIEGAKEIAYDVAGSGVFEAARPLLAARKAAKPVASAAPGDPNIRTLDPRLEETRRAALGQADSQINRMFPEQPLGVPAAGVGDVQAGKAFARDNPALAAKVDAEAARVTAETPVRRFITDVEQAEAARDVGFREIKAAEFAKSVDGVTFHAMGNVWGRNTDQLTEAYVRLQDINAGRVNVPPASAKNELTVLQQTIDALEAENKDLLKTYIGQASEAGRTLRSLQAVGNRSLDPLAWNARAARAADRPLSIEEIQQINHLTTTKDRDGLAKLVQELAPPVRFFGKKSAKGAFFNAVRRAGFLTGGRTQAKNFFSNTGEITLQSADQPVQALIDTLIGAYSGTRSVGLVNPIRRFLVGGRGLLRGVRTGVKVAAGRVDISPGTARKIEQPFQRLEIADPEAVSPVLKGTVMRANRWVDGYVKFMGRFQDAADRPFRQAAFEQSILDQATASTLHLQGKARKEAIKEFTERALANPTDEMALFAASVAEEAVFQNRSVAGKFISGAKGNLRRIGEDPTRSVALRQGARAGKFVADYFVPFSNTPGAVVGRIVERSPLGFANTLTGVRQLRDMARNVTAGELDIQHLINLQRDVSKSTARALTGTLAILTGAELARRGHMSGRYPEDGARRDLMIQKNVIEDAILIDGRWRKLTGISPLGNLVALGAQMALDFEDPDYTTSETLSQAGFGISRTVMDQSFLRGTKELLDAVTGGQAAARFPQQAGSSVVPVIVRDVTNVIDPRIRAPENFKQAIQSNIPGYSFQVPVSLDRLGRPRRRDPEGRASGLIDPFSSRTAISGDDVTRELNRVDARIPRLSRRRKGARDGRATLKEDETEEQFRVRVQATGQETTKALQVLFGHSGYRRLSEQQQQDAALAVIRTVRGTITRRGRAPPSWRGPVSRQIALARRP